MPGVFSYIASAGAVWDVVLSMSPAAISPSWLPCALVLVPVTAVWVRPLLDTPVVTVAAAVVAVVAVVTVAVVVVT